MIHYEGTFEDKHGVIHTNPTFVISYANYNGSNSTNYEFGHASGDYVNTTNQNYYVNYNVMFWTNEEARLDGRLPIRFELDECGNGNFNFSLKLPIEDVIKACEDHFIDYIENDYDSEDQSTEA